MLRYKIYVLIFFILSILGIRYVNASIMELPLLGKVIYIDPGHGGKDPGAVYKNIMEKDINLSISEKIEKKLTALGAIVYMTRYGDYDLSVTYTINNKRRDLSRRANLIKKAKADIFISIHLNAEDTGTWKGEQVFYNSSNPKNKILAEIFQKEFKKYLNSNRKCKINNSLYLLKRINSPGVLLELGFLSNANNRYLLTKDYYQEKLAVIIQNGILKYFQNHS